MNVFVSIIMPTYNRGYLIQNAVNSVLEQTHSKWELIIVDDGSKDNTKEIIQKNADHRIRYIRYDNNQGANHARNVGLKEAKGDYICFLDSDSMLYENCLQKRIDFINKTGSDFIWGRVNFSHVDGIERIKPSESAEILIDRDQTVKTHMLYGLIDTNSVLMKKGLSFFLSKRLRRLL
ncbi:glycosyltransferase family 2 protein [Selenomonas sp. KH1T6]|uniref:glycosyltransferase family 2 protein n=1 Tax=Selenomonas sp. KH1T6 TaxID=3158784 RepID=UPI0008A7400C|nr:Glycosyl transferase family 2 [Selenomonas ruminantium]